MPQVDPQVRGVWIGDLIELVHGLEDERHRRGRASAKVGSSATSAACKDWVPATVVSVTSLGIGVIVSSAQPDRSAIVATLRIQTRGGMPGTFGWCRYAVNGGARASHGTSDSPTRSGVNVEGVLALRWHRREG